MNAETKKLIKADFICQSNLSLLMPPLIRIPSRFRKRHDLKAWLLLSSNVFIMIFSGVIAWWIDSWWAYLLAFILVGARGQACYILQHEAMHNLLFTKIKTNERVGV